MSDAQFREFHRIVRADLPTLADFLSNLALGKEVPVDPMLAELWDGISVQSTLSQARRKRRVSPALGQYVAVLRIPTDGSVRFRRTRGEGHFTLWADPADILAMVVSVVPA